MALARLVRPDQAVLAQPALKVRKVRKAFKGRLAIPERRELLAVRRDRPAIPASARLGIQALPLLDIPAIRVLVRQVTRETPDLSERPERQVIPVLARLERPVTPDLL